MTITCPLASFAAVYSDLKDENASGAEIPTETATYSLSNDGRSADPTVEDYHFKTALSGLTKYNSEYKLYACVRLYN